MSLSANTKTTQQCSHTRRLGFITALVIGLTALHLLYGARSIPIGTLAQALFHYNPHDFDHRVLISLRLPRVLAMLLAGSCLAIAGYLLQITLRNRLSDPHLLGLNAGASLAVVLVTAFPIAPLFSMVRPLVASVGAALLFSLVLVIASAGKKGLQPLKLIFCGIAFSALAGAITSTILILDEDTLDQLRFWLIGDGAGANLHTVLISLPFAGAGLVLSLLIMPQLSAMSLGDAMAKGLGASVQKIRFMSLLAAALLTGSAVSAVGPIGFIGLISAALWRGIHSRPSAYSLALVAITGAAILMAADMAAISLFAPKELPTGALTGLVGAPVFLWIFVRRMR
ncbi:FecCD family ABC transporter permease [Marinomonas pollencensis]|uniref:Iron complex transport system permease protein n=1 Tax=Marinomonas pollencensis TaxID=491954 RepID=A0A3E0DVF1_9GAMM|nr:iron ABC transporter permease [Marinomonas pollencensis]REG86835.1 iron complex transport system permease protein [Marinomonas pollencensis]